MFAEHVVQTTQRSETTPSENWCKFYTTSCIYLFTCPKRKQWRCVLYILSPHPIEKAHLLYACAPAYIRSRTLSTLSTFNGTPSPLSLKTTVRKSSTNISGNDLHVTLATLGVHDANRVVQGCRRPHPVLSSPAGEPQRAANLLPA